MTKYLAAALAGLGLLASSAAFAGEKTVTLAVQNMYCSACPITVKSSLEAVPGVAKVVVSYANKTAVVTFEAARGVRRPGEPRRDVAGHWLRDEARCESADEGGIRLRQQKRCGRAAPTRRQRQ